MEDQMKKTQDVNDTTQVRLSSSGYHLKVLGTWLDSQMNKRLKPLGLSLNQFTIIMTLLEQDGLTQVQISKKVMLPAYATTRNLDKLESLGFIERQKHETSRRSFSIRLTEEGRNLAPTLFQASSEVNEQFLSPLDKQEKIVFLRILNSLTGSVKQSSSD